eukprot:g5614.t1
MASVWSVWVTLGLACITGAAGVVPAYGLAAPGGAPPITAGVSPVAEPIAQGQDVTPSVTDVGQGPPWPLLVKPTHFAQATLFCDAQRAMAWNARHGIRPNAFTAAAIESLRATKHALDAAGVPFFVSDGTLLGWHRNCMPIPYDDDVDIGVMIGDWKPSIVPSMAAAGFTHVKTVGSKEAGLTEVFEKAGVRQDIMFYYADREKNQTFSQVWQDGASFRFSWTPFSLRHADVFGMTIRVPSNVERYLREHYGNFMEPRSKRDRGAKRWANSQAHFSSNPNLDSYAPDGGNYADYGANYGDYGYGANYGDYGYGANYGDYGHYGPEPNVTQCETCISEKSMLGTGVAL